MPIVAPVYGNLTDPQWAKDITDAVNALNDSVAVLPYRARFTFGSGASGASVTFTGIPTTLRTLKLFWTARSDVGATSSLVGIRINNDTGANYNYEILQSNNTVVAGAQGAAQTSLRVGSCTGSTAGANIYGSGEITIVGWDSPHANHLGMTFQNEAIFSNNVQEVGGGTYGSAGPYTTLTVLALSGNFINFSDFQIVGFR